MKEFLIRLNKWHVCDRQCLLNPVDGSSDNLVIVLTRDYPYIDVQRSSLEIKIIGSDGDSLKKKTITIC